MSVTLKSQQRVATPIEAGSDTRSTGYVSVAIVGLGLNLLLFVWSYWPTILELVASWINQPDYSHGFFVLPLAALFLYCRRETFPGLARQVSWSGLVLLGVSVAMRWFGQKYFLSAFEGWSIVFFVAGATWLLAGWSVFKWSLPAIAFLFFMVPLPYRLEMFLSLPLQGIATVLSAGILQLFGEPAVVEGHTIYMDGHTLEVAQACSGLRIFVTSLAIGSGFAILFHRLWAESVLVILAAIPIALIANAIRVASTGLLARHYSDSLSTDMIHDLPGWMMIPVTALLFLVLTWYLHRLVPIVRIGLNDTNK